MDSGIWRVRDAAAVSALCTSYLGTPCGGRPTIEPENGENDELLTLPRYRPRGTAGPCWKTPAHCMLGS